MNCPKCGKECSWYWFKKGHCDSCTFTYQEQEEIDQLRRKLEKQSKEIELRKNIMDRMPLCSDHRDKQHGKSCLACEIERSQKDNNQLRARLAEAEETLKHYVGCTCIMASGHPLVDMHASRCYKADKYFEKWRNKLP